MDEGGCVNFGDTGRGVALYLYNVIEKKQNTNEFLLRKILECGSREQSYSIFFFVFTRLRHSCLVITVKLFIVFSR